MAEIHLLQANLNHCAAAQDLLLQSMAQWLIHVAVVSEPYMVPARDNWVGDLTGTAALVRLASHGSPPFEKVARGRGCVAASMGSVTVVACYCSPNCVPSDFERFLQEVSRLVRWAHPSPVLVAGDFNAKSVAWGSPATNARGQALEEWAVSLGLVLTNRGSVNTCVRQQGSSIVDLTFTSAALARRVQDWSVLEEVETASDHRYIRYRILPSPAAPNSPGRAPGEAGPRWVLGRLDRELLVEAALVQSWSPAPEGPVDVEVEAEWLVDAMSRVCDASMPRARPCLPRRQVYWWSPEIAQIRQNCVIARRRYARSRRRRRNEAREAELYAAYRDCR
ncbi:uncharacterized protein LOC142981264 [Anticarsia gemmatalis]|uniref:uncharacterized protein LOC142981264 n=1 Tax=Anticarsia gemmatalis TaxID=129554 RepID=UPI003F75960F